MVGRRRVFGDKRRVTTEDQRANIALAKQGLDSRLARFDGENGALHGHCRAAPFFIIDPPVWDGRFGELLHALGLVAYDEWNIVMLAGDDATASACDLPMHPGPIPGLNVKITEMLLRLHARFQAGDPENTAIDSIRDELLDYVAFCRSGVVDILTAEHR